MYSSAPKSWVPESVPRLESKSMALEQQEQQEFSLRTTRKNSDAESCQLSLFQQDPKAAWKHQRLRPLIICHHIMSPYNCNLLFPTATAKTTTTVTAALTTAATATLTTWPNQLPLPTRILLIQFKHARTSSGGLGRDTKQRWKRWEVLKTLEMPISSWIPFDSTMESDFESAYRLSARPSNKMPGNTLKTMRRSLQDFGNADILQNTVRLDYGIQLRECLLSAIRPTE